MINIKNLSFRYNENDIIKNLNAIFDSNTSIIGKSGCGKTTLLHLISGILNPAEGKISINDKDNSYYKNEIGLVMQKGGVFPYKTVYENISLGLQVKKEKNIDEKVCKVAKKLGLLDKLGKYPKELSGGQVQRTALGRMLCMSPKILLLDEPFSSLDEITRQKLQDEIIKISNDEGILVITVTHSIQEAVILGKKLIAMGSDGSIVKEYDTQKYIERDIDYFNKCIEIDKEIRSILI
ncbi:MAG: ABC transporter ATP-binding protein [Eubacteriales bacterium]